MFSGEFAFCLFINHIHVVSYMYTYARGCKNIGKKQFSGVPSRGLQWDNKTYKIKSSICKQKTKDCASSGSFQHKPSVYNKAPLWCDMVDFHENLAPDRKNSSSTQVRYEDPYKAII